MFIKILLAKLVFHLSRFLKLGSGYTYSGHVALYLDKSLLKYYLDQLTDGVILVSGTNGKTTTTKIINEVLVKAGYTTVTNTSGANLLNGILSSLIIAGDISGKLHATLGVFEVDEFVLPKLLEITNPRIVLLLNLSRDQLDRYGETDSILEKWQQVLHSPITQVVYDSTQDYFVHAFTGKVNFRGFTVNNYGSDLKLKGYFNSKNISAANAICSILGISDTVFASAISSIDLAWGRGEIVKYKSNSYEILLAKNPASFNNNLDLIREFYADIPYFLLILNDNIPDGRDISWIYDIDTAKLLENLNTKNLYFAGTRSTEMALRIKYANILVKEEHIYTDINTALAHVSSTLHNKKVIVLPNYSAMLEFRKIVTGKKVL